MMTEILEDAYSKKNLKLATRFSLFFFHSFLNLVPIGLRWAFG